MPLRIRPGRRAPQRAGGQQALHEELIGAVRGQGQRDPAEQPRPERIGLLRIGAEVQHLEMPGAAGGADDLAPAAGNQRQQPEEHDQRAADVHEHLHDVGPDDGRHAAAHRVDDHRHAERDHGDRDRDLGDHRDDQRGREQPDAVGERSGDHEDDRGDVLDLGTEPPQQQFVRREQLAAEVRRQEQHADEHASDHVAERELKERHVAGVGAGRHADEAERAGFRGDDREADRPPRHRSAGQEVIDGGLLESCEPGAEGGDGEQVRGDDCVVDPGEDHAWASEVAGSPGL